MAKGITYNKNAILALVGILILILLVYSLTQPGGSYSVSSAKQINLRELLAVSIEVAQRGGDKVREVRINPAKFLDEKVQSKTQEGADEFVTLGDLKSHIAMKKGLERAFPGITVISEEKDKEELNINDVTAPRKELKELSHIKSDVLVPMSDITVWIDPLDATQEYTENLTEYVTTMVCVAVKGLPTIGVVHNPFEKTTSWAWVGHALSPDLLKGGMSQKKSDFHRVIVSRSHAGDVEKSLNKVFQDKAKAFPAGGAGYKVLQVLHGSVEVYLHVTNIKKWDVCAGNALIRAAQGRMTTLTGDNLDFSVTGSEVIEKGLVATASHNSELHQRIIKELKL